MACALRDWHLPPLPAAIGPALSEHRQGRLSLTGLGGRARKRLARSGSVRARARLELALADWTWLAIKGNVRRGRLFEMDRVLSAREADCLGYARLFRQLGRSLGLDVGIVEVVVDNAGRAVPHVANIVRLADGRTRFMDLWYGSRNIRHRRLGLIARRGGRWRIIDVNWRDLRRWEAVKGLPPRCVDSIGSYMIGNRYLERGIERGDAGELRAAERCYTAAIDLCRRNSRIYFNRAVARENLGDRRGAEADYGAALRDEAGLIRVQARLHGEVVGLMDLDRMGLSPGDEEIFLRRTGFMTGREVPAERVAARHHVPVQEVDRVVSDIRSRMAEMPGAGCIA